VPNDVSLWAAMQEQHGRTLAAQKHVPEVEIDIVCNEGFRKWGWLNEKEPVIEGRGYFAVDAVQQRIGQHNV